MSEFESKIFTVKNNFSLKSPVKDITHLLFARSFEAKIEDSAYLLWFHKVIVIFPRHYLTLLHRYQILTLGFVIFQTI